MGKFGIGARVRDRDGDEGVIVEKRKGERRVRYDASVRCSVPIWWRKSNLTPIAANDDTPEWQPKVGDRVRVSYGHGWDGDGEVILALSASANVRMDDGRVGGFDFSFLEPLPVVAEAQGAGDADKLTIEAGKHYRTRDGRKVLVRQSDHHKWPFIGDVGSPGGDTWFEADGTAPYLPHCDLVAEWIDDPVAVAPATATPAFKVGDRVLAKGRGWGRTKDIGFIKTIIDLGAHVEFRDGWTGGHEGRDFDGATNRWYFNFDDLEPADTPVSAGLKKGDLVTLSEPATVTGINNHHVHLSLATGGTYTLPRAALRVA